MAEEFDVEAWCEKQTQEINCAFASHAAARALVNISGSTRPKDYTGFSFDLTLLRATLTSAVAAIMPTADVKRSAAHSTSSARSASFSAASISSARSTSFSAASAASFSASAAVTDFYAAESALTVSFGSSSCASISAQILINKAAIPTLWEAGLWLDVEMPDAIAENWRNLRAEWQADPAMAFWVEWYDSILKGVTPDWELWRDVVLIDDVTWDAGPNTVADAIETVKAKLLAKRAPVSEAIIFDNDQGKFQLEYNSSNKPDLLGATLDQISDALDDATSNASNGLHEGSRETKVLQRAAAKHGNNPQRLEMDFTSVHASITRQIASNELPPSEENLALLSAVEQGAHGIRATHPDIAENRKILTNQAIRELPAAAHQDIKGIAPLLSDLSTGELAEDFITDAQDIIDSEIDAVAYRPLGGHSRNPSNIARDEKLRFFSRAAKIAIVIKKTPDLVHRIDKSAIYKGTRFGLVMEGLWRLVSWGISLFL